MAHPDHDRVIGRLVGARLRGPAGRGPGGASAAEAHPDAETWAAYVDGGLLPDEVNRLEDHLGGCGACRRLVAALAPEVSVAAIPAIRDNEAGLAARATVIPFPRRQIFVWMGVAASLFAAVTLWSVSRLGSNARVMEMAASVPAAEPAAAPPAAPPPTAAASERSATAPTTRADAPAPAPVDQLAARPSASTQRRPAQAEQDKIAAESDGDTLARQRVAAAAPAAGRSEPATGAGAIAGAATRGAGAAQDAATSGEGAKPAEEKRLADAPVVDPRQIQLQTNTVAAGSARARGPLANQATNTQQNAPVAPTPPPPPAPMVAAGPAPPPAAAPAATKPDAAKAPAQADARERRNNEQQVGGLAEIVSTTGAASGARAPRRASERAQAVGADRSGAALSKDEAGAAASFSFTAAPVFAEPGGRLQWRIVDGRQLQSSSDGGTTWSSTRHTARRRLRAGMAPGIDSAWAVGEDGLVLRFAVPGGWTVVSPPEPVTLIGVSASSAQSARVTAADGRVFETADGGATWTPATPGAGPR
jgi:hypothetical protein